MKGFKNSTRTQYSMGGDVYAKGGMAKGAAKVAKVMGEFKKGELHSGSKEGPKVTKPAQAKAIAMSEARKAGMKAPMKKGNGGDVKMPSPAESAASGNRMSEMEAKEERFMARRAPGVGSMTEREKREMKKRVPATRREPLLPPVGESVKSGNRMSAQEAAEARAMGIYKTGGGVQKKAMGGPVQQGAATTQAPRGGPLDVVKNPSNLLTQANRVMSDQRARVPQLQARAQQARMQASKAKPLVKKQEGGLAVMPKGKC